MRCSVYWVTRDQAIIDKIRTKAGIPKYTTLNGLSPCECSEEVFTWLKECEKFGAIRVRECDWELSGGVYSFRYVKVLK